MPDGSSHGGGIPHPLARTAARVMDDHLQARAAVAWIRLVAPGQAAGVAADDRGVDLHLQLFARDPRYWQALCRLFRELGLSDGGWA